ncbi:MAG: tRNA pseudouridine(13) synthase TruD [Wenzhouxiangellaceae bacterium]|nr:tRNA pseudouridine(13) synthase TruD [Wenzhouxiangellaceae bacterium]
MAERAWGPAAGRGRIRTTPDDFRVIENLGYAPTGEGEHLWLEIEKRERNTLDVARDLARAAGISERFVGFAGLKDRNAVTRQPFTLHLAGRADPDWQEWQIPGVRIVSAARHQRKIQRGRLRGNRFELCVREFEGDREQLEQQLAKVVAGGVPNRFGEQRFGGNNIARAHRMFRGELKRPPSRAKRGFYLSAARALIFNRVLDERIRAGSWNQALHGDVLMLDGTHSIFAPDPLDADIPARIEGLDVHPTGPMVGNGEPVVSDQVAALEQEIIEREAELAEGLRRFGLNAERRALRMRVHELEWHWLDGRTLQLAFALGAGSFATTVLEEFLDFEDASVGVREPGAD